MRASRLLRAAVSNQLARPAWQTEAGYLPTRDQILIFVDGRPVWGNRQQSIIELLDREGYTIPHFCYAPHLSVDGNCRLCYVQVGPLYASGVRPGAGSGMPMNNDVDAMGLKPLSAEEKTEVEGIAPLLFGEFVLGCMYTPKHGDLVWTHSMALEECRGAILEFFLMSHPLDCPICDQGGMCNLQELSQGYGLDNTRFADYKRAFFGFEINALVRTVMNRCILCTKCIRLLDEVTPEPSNLGVMEKKGWLMEIHTFSGSSYVSKEFSANVVDVCPVGALNDKATSHESRPWEVEDVDAVDFYEPTLPNTTWLIRENEISAIHAGDQPAKPVVTDKARFAPDGMYYSRRDAWQMTTWSKTTHPDLHMTVEDMVYEVCSDL